MTDSGVQEYARGCFEGWLYDAMLRQFDRGGLSRSELAIKIGKGPEYIDQLLGGAVNLHLDDVSDFFLAYGYIVRIEFKEIAALEAALGSETVVRDNIDATPERREG